MQDKSSIGAVTERSFGGGDRRLRPHHQNPPVKCPRCESLNTKFCYYNNYNLSQPRHFCKTCRRYWTNGGVIRNDPVGGGCRKTKCSKPKKSSPKFKTPRECNSNSISSSENSSLTESTPITKNITDEASGSKISSDSSLFNFSDSRLFVPEGMNTNFEGNSSEGTVFSEFGTFRGLITETNDEIMAGFIDQTVHIDVPRSNNEDEFTPLDWRADHEELFEFTGTVDESFWSQNHWSDDDHSLFTLM